jgi:hypothetical protein
MKKLMFVLVLMITTVVVNAQRTRFSPEELPKAIKENIAKEHPGFNVKQAVWDWSTNYVPNHVFVYDIVITDGTKDEALIYDKEGKFLKKGVVKIETAETTDGSMPKNPSPKRQR